MPFSLKQLARVAAFAVGVTSAQLTQAQTGSPFQFSMQLPSYNYGTYEPVVKSGPIDGYFYNQATTRNGRQVAKVLEPALDRLLTSGQLTSEQIKNLEKLGVDIARAPGGMGAVLEQLAGSQNANLASAAHATTGHISDRLLSTLRTLPTDDDGHFWVQGLGNDGSLDKQGGSAGLKYGIQGVLLGADWALDDAWRIGVVGAKSNSHLDAKRFAGDLDSWHLGGYAVHQDGPLALRLGAIHSDHAGQNKRSVEVLDRKDSLKASYGATSQTLFSEMGYQLGNADYSVEPFAGLGYQRYHRDGFKESGGISALNVEAQTRQNLSSTLGLRLATVYRFDNQISLTPHVDTRWKRLYGDVESQVRQSYRYVPGLIDGFNINGTALDRNSVNISAGLDLAWSPQHTVGLTYSAENGTNSRSQGLMGQWQMRF